jgi:hypothetical protein
MKNIHILPTDKPSRLYSYKSIELFLHPTIVDANVSNLHCQNQNIYITSDEEIKEGGYVFWEGKIYAYREFMKMRTPVYTDYFPTILTTDQDLIKDGVQAIDDEFLEWFVKNPSCERVSIEEEDYSQKCRECGETVKRGYNCAKGCFMKSGNFIPTDKNINYKIIIPQEQLKPHSFCETPESKCTMNYCDENGCQNRKRELVEPQEEPKQETLEEKLDKIVSKEPSKFWKESDERFRLKGTLEEVAENESEYLADYDDKEMYQKGFIDGAKWQQEQDKNKFSEEEVRQMLWDLGDVLFNNNQNGIKEGEPKKYIEEIIEQFKNK